MVCRAPVKGGSKNGAGEGGGVVCFALKEVLEVLRKAPRGMDDDGDDEGEGEF